MFSGDAAPHSTAKLCKHRDVRSGVLDNGLAKTYGFPSEIPTVGFLGHNIRVHRNFYRLFQAAFAFGKSE